MKFSKTLPCLLVSATIFTAGCSTVVQNPTPLKTVSEMNKKSTTNDYKLTRGDEIDMRFVYTPELNSTVTVRPDGKISAPLIGDVKVAGMSTAQLSDLLKKSYADQVKRPDIAINVRGFANQRIFIGGEVVHAGAQPLSGSVGVLQAIMLAEGLKETARTKEVVIVRRGENDERTVFSVNLDDIINGSDTSQDIELQAYDVVLVPRSGIANVNVWVDQYIRKNIPVNFGVSYNLRDNVTVR